VPDGQAPAELPLLGRLFEVVQKHLGRVPALMAGYGIAFLATYMLRGFTEPPRELIEYEAWQRMPILRHTLADLAALVVQGYRTEEQAREEAAERGMNPHRFHELVQLTGNPPGIETALEMWRRGLIPESSPDPAAPAFENAVRQSRYKTQYLEAFKGLRWHLPSVSDSIRFLVREAFKDDVAQKYGYDEDLPLEQARSLFQKLGVSEEDMRRYWRSHWELPSPTMGYQMLHRGVISREELEDLLRIADYPRYWREKLISISFNPFTRVDIRRMYRDGVLSKDEVLRAYKDIGYDDWHAQKLTEWTVREAARQGSDFTKSEVLSLADLGLLPRDKARELLQVLGESEESADLLLEARTVARERRRLETLVNQVRARYLAGRIDEQQAARALDRLGVHPDVRDDLLAEWQVLRETPRVTPTEAQLRAAAQRGLITWDQYEDRLIAMGYSPEDASLLRSLYAAPRPGRTR
jgi:hypothetical protein